MITLSILGWLACGAATAVICRAEEARKYPSLKSPWDWLWWVPAGLVAGPIGLVITLIQRFSDA